MPNRAKCPAFPAMTYTWRREAARYLCLFRTNFVAMLRSGKMGEQIMMTSWMKAAAFALVATTVFADDDAIKAGKLVQVNVKGAPSWNICIARKMNNERSSVEAIWKNLVQAALEISRSD